jgi:uncharacterized protein YlxW (UPF0749 family)
MLLMRILMFVLRQVAEYCEDWQNERRDRESLNDRYTKLQQDYENLKQEKEKLDQLSTKLQRDYAVSKAEGKVHWEQVTFILMILCEFTMCSFCQHVPLG